MTENYTDKYIDDCFYAWYNNGKTTSKNLLDKLERNESGNLPGIMTIKKWMDDYGWIQRADALDAKISIELDQEVINDRVEMYKRHAEIGKFQVEEGFRYLKENGIKKEETALRAITDGADLQRKSVGFEEVLRKVGTMSAEQLDNELQKLLGKKKDSEFIEGESIDVPEEK